MTVDVYERAETAARRGDAKTFDDCLEELASRKRGEELIEELRDLREEITGPDLPAPITRNFDVSDLKGFAVVTDRDCHARLQMLRGAERSIWLSTYSLNDGRGELREILAERVRKRVTVNLIVHPKTIRPGGHTEEVIDELEGNGVRVSRRKSHSKCVIVDEEHCMIGSSNLQAFINREVGLQFSSASVARLIIEYLVSVIRSTD